MCYLIGSLRIVYSLSQLYTQTFHFKLSVGVNLKSTRRGQSHDSYSVFLHAVFTIIYYFVKILFKFCCVRLSAQEKLEACYNCTPVP